MKDEKLSTVEFCRDWTVENSSLAMERALYTAPGMVSNSAVANAAGFGCPVKILITDTKTQSGIKENTSNGKGKMRFVVIELMSKLIFLALGVRPIQASVGNNKCNPSILSGLALSTSPQIHDPILCPTITNFVFSPGYIFLIASTAAIL